MSKNRSFYRYIVFLFTSILSWTLQAAFSQVLTPASLKTSFESYAQIAAQEKLFLHTDKDFYLAGEICWFRIYYIDGVSHKPAHLSKLAYAEIIDDKGHPVLQAKISLLPEESSGSFYLPASMNTGHYTLRAYTNWMKNFEQTGFFEKKITVLNTIRTPVSTQKPDSIPVEVNFFPEGGNLVNGIRSRMGVMVKRAGEGIPVYAGYILDRNNDTVSSFTPLKFGIGSFDFKPQSGNPCKVVVILPDGESIIKQLPEVYEYGYAMSVREDGKGKIAVTVQRRKMPGEEGRTTIVLAVHTRQVLDVVENAEINDNDSTVFLINRNKLGEGISHFTIFTQNGSPVCERLFFNKPSQKIILQATADQPAYAKRQRVSLNIKASYPGVNEQPLDLSLSVFYLDSLQGIDQSTIVDYAWLVSDLAGNIESPGYYFSDGPEVTEATDNLMLTHGWRRFKWENILSPSTSFIKYLPEINGQLITGVVRNRKNNNAVVPRVNAFLSIDGRPFGFFASQSDRKGLVHFEVKEYYGNKQVIAQTGNRGDSLWVDILKPYAVNGVSSLLLPYIPDEREKEAIRARSIAMQAQNIYLADSLRNFRDHYIADTLPFFGVAGVSYKLDDYQRFTTMEEVLREYVREIGVGARNGKLIFKMFNPAAHDFYDYEGGSTLVLLDGVPLADADKIFQYNPLNVKKLEVIEGRYVMGPAVFDGVASFTTYDGTFDGFELDPHLVTIDYPGLQLQREFYSPVYDKEEQLGSRIPDYRNTLFWSPVIHTSKEGNATIQFYSSDMAGRYAIVAQGMSADGNFVSVTGHFEIE